MEPKHDPSKAWGIYEEEDGFYYYSLTGNPYGPYKDEDAALNALEGYIIWYEYGDSDKNE